MSCRNLLNFLLQEQREEEATIADALKLIHKYEVDGAGTKRTAEVDFKLNCGSLPAS